LNRSPANSYQAVQAAIMKRIQDRQWTPGEFIPNETALAEEFGVARATMNRALRQLAETGILERRRRAGTRVALNPVRKAVLDIPVIRHEIEARGSVYGYTLVERERVRPTPRLRARLTLAADADLLHVACVHFADHRPFQFEDRWIHVASAPKILEAPLETISANEWLVQQIPYSHGEIVFSAASAAAREAEHLGVNEGAALFVIERTTWLADAPITFVRMHYPEDYRMVTKL
jgi:GntR family histidine utilization transcriptional repressor